MGLRVQSTGTNNTAVPVQQTTPKNNPNDEGGSATLPTGPTDTVSIVGPPWTFHGIYREDSNHLRFHPATPLPNNPENPIIVDYTTNFQPGHGTIDLTIFGGVDAGGNIQGPFLNQTVNVVPSHNTTVGAFGNQLYVIDPFNTPDSDGERTFSFTIDGDVSGVNVYGLKADSENSNFNAINTTFSGTTVRNTTVNGTPFTDTVHLQGYEQANVHFLTTNEHVFVQENDYGDTVAVLPRSRQDLPSAENVENIQFNNGSSQDVSQLVATKENRITTDLNPEDLSLDQLHRAGDGKGHLFQKFDYAQFSTANHQPLAIPLIETPSGSNTFDTTVIFADGSERSLILRGNTDEILALENQVFIDSDKTAHPMKFSSAHNASAHFQTPDPTTPFPGQPTPINTIELTGSVNDYSNFVIDGSHNSVGGTDFRKLNDTVTFSGIHRSEVIVESNTDSGLITVSKDGNPIVILKDIKEENLSFTGVEPTAPEMNYGVYLPLVNQ